MAPENNAFKTVMARDHDIINAIINKHWCEASRLEPSPRTFLEPVSSLPRAFLEPSSNLR